MPPQLSLHNCGTGGECHPESVSARDIMNVGIYIRRLRQLHACAQAFSDKGLCNPTVVSSRLWHSTLCVARAETSSTLVSYPHCHRPHTPMEKSKPRKAQENKLEDLQKAGVEAYREKDYKAALEHFTAVRITPSPRTTRNQANSIIQKKTRHFQDLNHGQSGGYRIRRDMSYLISGRRRTRRSMGNSRRRPKMRRG